MVREAARIQTYLCAILCRNCSVSNLMSENGFQFEAISTD